MDIGIVLYFQIQGVEGRPASRQSPSPKSSEPPLTEGHPTSEGVLGSTLRPQNDAQNCSQNTQYHSRKSSLI